LPEIDFSLFEIIGQLLVESTLLRVALDRAAELHAALVFLLAACFHSTVLQRVIVVPRHILSPNTLREFRMVAGSDDCAAKS